MKWSNLLATMAIWTAAAAAQVKSPLGASLPPDDVRICPVEPEIIVTGGGMAGNGWDGAGRNPCTIFWHVEGKTNDFNVGQRTAIITALQTWANVVQIDFVEMPVPNLNQSIDLNFATGNHCSMESAECGDADCPFDGAGGTLAHAGYPPGVNSVCVNPMPETFAGNVHFDDAETWEQDNAGGVGPFSLTLTACHEIGHALGLIHDNAPGNIMNPRIGSNQAFAGLGSGDIANIRAGYAAGTGSVTTLEETGVWVNGAWGGAEQGTQSFPFDSVQEGVNGVPPASTDVTLFIHAGNYNETPRITQAMIIQPVGGSVIIGN